MNRTIKFRWVGLNKHFNEVMIEEGLTTNKILMGDYLTFFMLSNRGKYGNCKFICEDFCLDIKDKNYKDLYCNDIVTAWSEGVKGTFKIWYRKEAAPLFVLYPAWQNKQFWNLHATEYKKGKKFINVDGTVFTSDINAFIDDGIEKIGNIHQHKHLLENN